MPSTQSCKRMPVSSGVPNIGPRLDSALTLAILNQDPEMESRTRTLEQNHLSRMLNEAYDKQTYLEQVRH